MLGVPKPKRFVDRELLNKAYEERCINHYFWRAEPCHIQSRGAHGNDEWWNLLFLCRKCHSEQHAKGFVFMAEKYPKVKDALIARGWSYDEFRKKWVRY